MSYRFRTRNARRNKSLSDKFQIGKSKFVDDDDILSFKGDKEVFVVSELDKQKRVLMSEKKLESNKTSSTEIESVTCEKNIGRYVHNLEFSQQNDLSNLSNSECKLSMTKSVSEENDDHITIKRNKCFH